MSAESNYIDLKVTFGGTIFAKDILNEIQVILQEFAAAWSEGLRIVEPGGGGRKIDVWAADTIYSQIESESAVTPFYTSLEKRFGVSAGRGASGFVELRGSSAAITVVINFDKRRFPPSGDIRTWGNSLTMQIRRGRVEGQDCAEWARRVFIALCGRLNPWYGRANAAAEYEKKNLVLDRGAYAIGVDVSKSLPGLYWLNFFGEYCASSIGRDKIARAQAYETLTVGNGILIALDDDPRNWESASYHGTEGRVVAALGREYFFSRDAPNRSTVSPFAAHGHSGDGAIRLVGDGTES